MLVSNLTCCNNLNKASFRGKEKVATPLLDVLLNLSNQIKPTLIDSAIDPMMLRGKDALELPVSSLDSAVGKGVILSYNA